MVLCALNAAISYSARATHVATRNIPLNRGLTLVQRLYSSDDDGISLVGSVPAMLPIPGTPAYEAHERHRKRMEELCPRPLTDEDLRRIGTRLKISAELKELSKLVAEISTLVGKMEQSYGSLDKRVKVVPDSCNNDLEQSPTKKHSSS